ncbi:hypothetical protein FRB99_006189 [Tulasnella sp. 403]|nr:hypothetical protein FRB99_006189 [Tulasnella sp. 403]
MQPSWSDKMKPVIEEGNPVIPSAQFVYEKVGSEGVRVEEGRVVESVAENILNRMQTMQYSTSTTWRSHPLHFLPPTPYDPSHPRTREALDWVFFVSSLNFSFWSEFSEEERFGIEWGDEGTVWTGYWSLLAGIKRALHNTSHPITSPAFYAHAPTSVLESIFTPSPTSHESIPLLAERIAILRQNGEILERRFGGSWVGLLEEWMEREGESRTALGLVKMVIEAFPSFRDEVVWEGRKVCFWKRAQILVAETWAAFYPLDPSTPHPILPNGVGDLTMFADYRVPQILHTLGLISYPPALVTKLHGNVPFGYGSTDEMSIRAASILAVERLKAVMNRKMRERGKKDNHNIMLLVRK